MIPDCKTRGVPANQDDEVPRSGSMTARLHDCTTYNNIPMKQLSILVILILLLVSCKTNELYINVLHPAPVTVPPEIKSVGVINRSIPTDETKIADLIDKVLSLEGTDLDKDGAWESVRGLTEELMANGRFTGVRELRDIDFRASRIGVLPPPLSMEIVEKVCRETGTDALFSLERFDTDTRLNYSTNKVRRDTPLGGIPLLEHQVSMEVIIKTGWRIYVPSGPGILDEFSFAESLAFIGKGINPVAAVTSLMARKEAVKEVSRTAGHNYALRLLPYRLSIEREYFVKGTENFRTAKRKARTGNWDEAGLLWAKETESPSRKIAGRAFYNMAVISEINGNIDEAIEWARRSYEDFNIRKGLRYMRMLEARKQDDVLLRIQEEM